MIDYHFAVVEDNDDDFALIESSLKRFFDEKEIKGNITRFLSGEDFLSSEHQSFDIVFMDIMLPGKNGMETSHEFRKVNSETLLFFLTNMSQYAIEGYSVNALDYILKPLNYFSLFMKLELALRILNKKENSLYAIKVNGGKKLVDLDKVYYVDVMGHDISFYSVEEMFTTYGILKEYEEILKKFNFSRCSATSLVNLKYVDGIYGEEVLLRNGIKIAIGRAKKKSFLSDLSLFLGGNL